MQLLSANDVGGINDKSLAILEKVGVAVKNDQASLTLRNAGCDVDSEKKIVRIPRDLVKECLTKISPDLKLYDREGNREQTIGDDNVIFNPGSCAVYFSDHKTGEIRRPFSRDLVDLVRLVDALKNIQAQSTAMLPSDVPEEVGDLYRLYLVLKNSTKSVVTGAFSKQGLLDMKHLLETAVGGESRFINKPMAIFDVCPSSPLVWSDTACQNLIDCARLHVPAEIIPAPQMGATSPITLAGTLVQSNAEFLSGLVISQLTRRGAPLIYGGSPTTFDMKHLSSCLGSIENMMVACASAQVSKYYGLPCHAYLGLSDSKVLDAQSGIETSSGIMLGLLAGINVVSGPGMLAFENCQSLEKLVVDNEICGMALRLGDGLTFNDEMAGMDFIAGVGPGGHYLGERHTRKWLELERFMPSDLIDRLTHEAENKQGRKDMIDRARETVEHVLTEHVPEPLPIDLEKDLRNALTDIMNRYGIQSLPML